MLLVLLLGVLLVLLLLVLLVLLVLLLLLVLVLVLILLLGLQLLGLTSLPRGDLHGLTFSSTRHWLFELSRTHDRRYICVFSLLWNVTWLCQILSVWQWRARGDFDLCLPSRERAFRW